MWAVLAVELQHPASLIMRAAQPDEFLHLGSADHGGQSWQPKFGIMILMSMQMSFCIAFLPIMWVVLEAKV
jgi:hypothetical protein